MQNDIKISRRELLGSSIAMSMGRLILGTGALNLVACDTAQTVAIGPYAVWRELQSTLKQSPDHAIGRAENLVKADDINGLHKFVRDEIRLVSADGYKFVMGNAVKFGPRAALRAGAGTAREKAEILASLVRKTGREAEIVEILYDKKNVESFFYRDFEQSFAPPFSKKQLADWGRRLGHDKFEKPQSNVVDKDGSILKSLNENLQNVLGSAVDKIAASKTQGYPVGNIPIVKITDMSGAISYADPITPNSTVGKLPDGVNLQNAQPMSGAFPVSIEVSAITTKNPDAPISLVNAKWMSDDLAGRQLQIGFRPSGSMVDILNSNIKDLHVFAPVLSLQNLDEAKLSSDKAGVVMDAITLNGDHISVSDKNETLLNGKVLNTVSSLEVVASVKSIKFNVNAGTFPDISINVQPLNAAGQIVQGLSAGDFNIEDEGDRAGHVLNVSDNAPNILFLVDESASMPRDFRGKSSSSMMKITSQVKKVAKSIHPNATVRLKGTNSNLWEALTNAASQPDLNLIVYATDGDLTGEPPNDSMLRVLEKSPPAVILNVHSAGRYKAGEATINALAKATQGVSFNIESGNVMPAVQVIKDALNEDNHRPTYTLNYQANVGKKTKHRSITLNIGSAIGRASYDVLPQLSRAGKLAGLQLTLKMNGRSVTRALAGYDGVGKIKQHHIDETHGALFGQHSIAFEGSPVPLSVIFHDMLTAKLDLEDMDRTAMTFNQSRVDTHHDFIDALDKGRSVLSGKQATFLAKTAALSGDNFSTSECGLRCVLHSRHVVFDTHNVIDRLDILPLTETHILSNVRQVKIDKAFKGSLNLALGESILFKRSTVSDLAGKDLTVFSNDIFKAANLPESEVQIWRRHLKTLRRQYDYSRVRFIVAKDMSTRSLWAINEETGEVLGVLKDGSGGGSTEEHFKDLFKRIDRAAALTNLQMVFTASAGFGIVVAYSQRLARLYGAVAIAVAGMDARHLEKAVKMGMYEMICEVGKTVSMAQFGNVHGIIESAMKTISLIDNAASSAGGSTPFSCPI